MAVVSLRDVVEEMDTFGDTFQTYLNRRTGELFTVGDEERSALEYKEECDPDSEGEMHDVDLSPGDGSRIAKLREIQESEDWLQLPSKYEIDEYRIMEQFSQTIEDEALSGDLLDTIGGRGTFGRFKNMLHRHGIQDDWYRFREKALADIAVSWLEANGIEYTR